MCSIKERPSAGHRSLELSPNDCVQAARLRRRNGDKLNRKLMGDV